MSYTKDTQFQRFVLHVENLCLIFVTMPPPQPYVVFLIEIYQFALFVDTVITKNMNIIDNRPKSQTLTGNVKLEKETSQVRENMIVSKIQLKEHLTTKPKTLLKSATKMREYLQRTLKFKC